MCEEQQKREVEERQDGRTASEDQGSGVLVGFVIVHVIVVWLLLLLRLHLCLHRAMQWMKMRVLLLRRRRMVSAMMLLLRLQSGVCVMVIGRRQMQPVRSGHAGEDRECSRDHTFDGGLRSMQDELTRMMHHGRLRQHATWPAHAPSMRHGHGTQRQGRRSVVWRVCMHGMLQEVGHAVQIGRRGQHRRIAHAHDLVRVVSVCVVCVRIVHHMRVFMMRLVRVRVWVRVRVMRSGAKLRTVMLMRRVRVSVRGRRKQRSWLGDQKRTRKIQRMHLWIEVRVMRIRGL